MREWCVAHEVRILMVAHHLQDQAETFLMRLQRGSGLEGLSCMREVSEWRGLKILRPLLGCSPAELRAYLQQRKIQWIEDESNLDTRYLRNKMRAFLPILAEKTGITPQCLAATAERLQSAEEYIETEVERVWAAEVKHWEGDVYCCKHSDFLRWHREIKFRVVAQLCRREYIPRAERILKAVALMSKIPFAGLTLGGKEIFGAYGYLWVVPEIAAKRKASRKEWKEFVRQNPQYDTKKIPHKARVAILEYRGMKDDL